MDIAWSSLPEVLPTISFDEMLECAAAADHTLFCYEGEGTEQIGTLLSRISPQKGASLSLVIGSEGGFSLSEAQRASASGFHMTGLGPRILRTETAPLFALACISCALELS